MTFSDDFFLALDNDGDGHVDIKDFATRIVASGKIPNGVNAEEAIRMVINTSWLTACVVRWPILRNTHRVFGTLTIIMNFNKQE